MSSSKSGTVKNTKAPRGVVVKKTGKEVMAPEQNRVETETDGLGGNGGDELERFVEGQSVRSRNKRREERRKEGEENVSEDEEGREAEEVEEAATAQHGGRDETHEPSPAGGEDDLSELTRALLGGGVVDFSTLPAVDRARLLALVLPAVGGQEANKDRGQQGSEATQDAEDKDSGSEGGGEADDDKIGHEGAPSDLDSTTGIPVPVINLLKNGQHVPLTILTNSVLQTISRGGSAQKYSKYRNRDGEKVEVLDVSQFPAEEELPMSHFQLAYQNLFRLLERTCQKPVIDLFKKHYDHLITHSEFEDCYSAILAFDIEIRQKYFAGERKPFIVPAPAYTARMQAFMIRKAAARSAPELVSSGADRRYHPYHDAHSSRGGFGRSFRGGRQHDSSRLPVCLICGQVGHKAPVCGRTTLASGKATCCVWSDGKLLDAVSRKEACVIWNLSGRSDQCDARRCPGKGSHWCSFCGTTEHHANSRRCIAA